MASELVSANMAVGITKVVASEALPALVGNLVMGNLVNRSYDDALAQSGDTVSVPIIPAMTVTNLAEAGTVSNQNPSPGFAQLVLTNHPTATFTIPDVTKAIASFDMIRGYLRSGTIAIAEDIETNLLALYPLLTANTAVGSAATLTEAVTDNAETALFNAKVPGGDPKFLVLSPTAYSQLRQLARFSDYQSLGDANASMAAIASGQVMRVKDFAVFRSNYVAKPSATTYNLGFTRNAMGLVTRRLPMAMPGTGVIQEFVSFGNFGIRITMSYNANQLAQTFTLDCFYGIGILRNNHGVQVQSN